MGGVTETDEIAAWLRVQAEADIAKAAAATPGRWAAGGGRDGEPRWLPLDCVTAPDYRPPGFSQGQHVADCIIADGGMGPWAADLRGSGFPAGNARHIAAHDPPTETARAESVLAVLDDRERTAAIASPAECPQGEIAGRDYLDALRELAVLDRVVRLLAYGYRRREGWKEAWGVA